MPYKCDDPAPVNYPYDQQGPDMVSQVTQVGYGGPFVIRSNPIGAIVDTIRGFCFPQPMQADGEGFETDAELGTPGAVSASLGYGAGSFGGFGGGVVAPIQPASSSGIMDEVPMMSTTKDPEVISTCGYERLTAMQEKLAVAASNCDIEGINVIRRLSPICEKLAPPVLRPQFKALSAQARSIGAKVERDCKALKKRKVTPTANILNANKMPSMPSPMTLTEGNPSMQAFHDPLAGHFDVKNI